MDRLKAGYEKLKGAAEHVALNSDFMAVANVAPPKSKARHVIGSRIVVDEKQISEGGFAYVWLVRDERTKQELVLKKILCQDKTALTMAMREIELLEKLPQHPNLVRYFGYTIEGTEGKKSKEVGLLFELCPDGHLLHLLERHQGNLSEQQIVSVLSELTKGVEVLHNFSPPVQHRDLKVENVLMGADGQWKLLDFGSWSDERSEPTKMDKPALGALQEQIEKYTTMMYRPPEMVDFFQGFVISEKVDLWMIGCILYTLMYYRHPFQDESPLAIANARYVMPSTSSGPPAKLQDLTHWLLARDPGDRPSAPELSRILQNFANAELALPKAVVERRDHVRRIYEQPGRKALVTECDAGERRHKHKHGKTKEHKEVRDGKESKKRREPNANPWGEVLNTPDAWPSAALSPVPANFAWAAFDNDIRAQERPRPAQLELDASQPIKNEAPWQAFQNDDNQTFVAHSPNTQSQNQTQQEQLQNPMQGQTPPLQDKAQQFQTSQTQLTTPQNQSGQQLLVLQDQSPYSAEVAWATWPLQTSVPSTPSAPSASPKSKAPTSGSFWSFADQKESEWPQASTEAASKASWPGPGPVEANADSSIPLTPSSSTSVVPDGTGSSNWAMWPPKDLVESRPLEAQKGELGLAVQSKAWPPVPNSWPAVSSPGSSPKSGSREDSESLQAVPWPKAGAPALRTHMRKKSDPWADATPPEGGADDPWANLAISSNAKVPPFQPAAAVWDAFK